jgi:hypothetical protein
MTDNRIAEIEAKIASAQAELAAIKSGKAPPPPKPPPDEGPRILQLLDERTDNLPNLAELKKLFAVVKNLVPDMKSHDPDAGVRGFAGAYRFVSNCGRIAVPNSRVSLSWWLEGMTAWLRARNAITRDVSGSSFIAAIFAAGDIAYTPHNAAIGTVWEFAILPPDRIGGKPASDAWRRVLTQGVSAILPPSAPARRMPAPSQVRIYGG